MGKGDVVMYQENYENDRPEEVSGEGKKTTGQTGEVNFTLPEPDRSQPAKDRSGDDPAPAQPMEMAARGRMPPIGTARRGRARLMGTAVREWTLPTGTAVQVGTLLTGAVIRERTPLMGAAARG